MAELLANVAIAGPGGLPEPYFMSRWRTVARSLTTWRPLPALVAIRDDEGRPTEPYLALFHHVFAVSIDPDAAIVDEAGKPTRSHLADWRRI